MGKDERTGSPGNGDSGAEVPLDVLPLHSTNLLTVLDEDGVVRYESPSIERVLGFEPTAPVGDPVADYVHPDDREHVLDAFRSIVTAGEYVVESVEYRHARADGSYCWVESVASADPTPDGHYVVNTRDTSDRRKRERTLERSNERLEEFARVVSHDLRNPLNVASLGLQLAREDGDSEHLDDVERALERMDALIEDLLALAQGGTAVAEVEPVDLAGLAETCWRTVETADATLVADVDRTIRADRSRLRQLLENLVGNAVDHGDGSVTITIGALEDEPGFYVADDGPGIPEAGRERVFESGYSTREDGTGFGLTIVTRIAEAHGWDVVVTEGADGGARFEILTG